jgi:PBP1b-binding outer membrane lipoprotein LpoB
MKTMMHLLPSALAILALGACAQRSDPTSGPEPAPTAQMSEVEPTELPTDAAETQTNQSSPSPVYPAAQGIDPAQGSEPATMPSDGTISPDNPEGPPGREMPAPL